jgi:hypothetical protein
MKVTGVPAATPSAQRRSLRRPDAGVRARRRWGCGARASGSNGGVVAAGEPRTRRSRAFFRRPRSPGVLDNGKRFLRLLGVRGGLGGLLVGS